MITIKENIFSLTTNHTSYLLAVRGNKYIENLYYGKKIHENFSVKALSEKFGSEYGNTIRVFPEGEERNVTLDNLCLEYSFVGNGDYRALPMTLRFEDGTYSQRFIYKDCKTYIGLYEDTALTNMPYAHHDNEYACEEKGREVAVGIDEGIETLDITLEDKQYGVILHLIYTVFEKTDVITRRCVLKNISLDTISIQKCMSMQFDLPEKNYSLSTFDGLWARERMQNKRKLQAGMYVNESTTGASSNRHNPFILLEQDGCTNDYGNCYGFNLLYSGNHYEAVEVSEYEKLRVLSGINPFQFEWRLGPDETFYTPEAVMSFSHKGNNTLSQNLSRFVRNHIINKEWAYTDRPVLINNWEATYFDFDKKKLIAIAKEAKNLGIELFVLDDGWFGDRSDDTKGLGDWIVNEKKLGGTLKSLVDRIHKEGLLFGLWMEPEMINENSNLYRAHPDWAVKIPGRESFSGRNQLVLDYANAEVRNYIVEVIGNVLDSAAIEYIKWDMNRHISDAYSNTLGNAQGEFSHRYILGLYEVMKRVTEKYPKVLFESCSSGGNRFDLGMLFYMPQIWTSDDTDANERIAIQEGTSYGYPLSSMGAHVSAAPNHQTLRKTSIETRFDVACFGDLGYELDLTALNSTEKKMVTRQVEFYKRYRSVFQRGDFYRGKMHNGNVIWTVVDENKEMALAMIYEKLAKPNSASDILKVPGLQKDAMYKVTPRKVSVSIKQFGSLINQVSPVHITDDGLLQSFVNKVYTLDGEKEEYTVSGDLLSYAGIKLNQRFMGTGYNESTRVMGDFSSRLYTIEKVE